MQKKQYEINSQKFFQEELTLEQDEKILALLKNLNLKDGLESLKIVDFASSLFENNVIGEFLSVILLPADGAQTLAPESAKKIKNSTLSEIISDFFTLNNNLIQLLKTFAPALAGMNTTPTSPSSSANQNQKNSTFKEKERK